MSDNRQEAFDALNQYVATFKQYLTLAENDVDVYDLPAWEDIEEDERETLTDEGITEGGYEDMTPLNEYGLEWSKETLNYRDETITYRHVLATGGPHFEFLVTFAHDTSGKVESVTFVSMPWFGREEIGDASLPQEVNEFYATFYGGLVASEIASGS